MGIFDGLFGGSNEKSTKTEKAQMPWNVLTTIEQLDALVTASLTVPVMIFKHSTTCGISRMVIRQLESEYDFEPSQLQAYYLDLKAYRNISNEIAARFKVLHQSPQVILIKNGTAVYNDSHGAISVQAIAEKL